MNILQDILGLFKRNKFTTPKNKDVIYVARNQKQSHLVEPKLDSKVMELKSLKDWILTGVDEKKAHEPFSYPNGTYLSPIELHGNYNKDFYISSATKYVSGGTFDNWGFPFMVQQDVMLFTYNFYIPNGAEDDALYFNLCVYEFDAVIDYNDTRFKLVKEEAKVIGYGAGGGAFYIGFTTPFRLIAGKIYLVCVIPQSGTTLELAGTEHNGSTKRGFPINKFLGGYAMSVGGGNITTKFTAVVTGTSAPATIDCRHVVSTGDVGFEYIKMNLQNA